MKSKIIYYLLFIVFIKTNIYAQTYVTVTSSCGFSISGTNYKPLVCNYLINFVYDYSGGSSSTGNYYISPDISYSTNWGYPDTWGNSSNNPNYSNGIYYFSTSNNKSTAQTKLTNDLTRMKNLGFTEIRLIGTGMINSGGTWQYPTGESISSGGTNYFTLLNSFFTAANTAGLRIIFLLGGSTEYTNNVNYKNFIASIATNFKNSTALMAYDLMNEPANGLWETDVLSKYNFTKMISEWNSAVKNKDPNHLTTIGLESPIDISAFDALMLSIDFVSFHPYPNSTNLSTAETQIDVYNYWCGKTITIPWIIGETSFSANSAPTPTPYCNSSNVGSITDQASYVGYTLQSSINGNGKGYSWWQYQEDNQNPNNTSCTTEDFMGLFYRYAGSTEGTYKPAANPTTSAFLNYQSLTKSTPSQPSAYYTALGGNSTTSIISGTVKDNNGNLMANAVVVGKDQTYGEFTTFTNSSGHFDIYMNSSSTTVTSIDISYPGYSTSSISYPSSSQTYTLTRENYNSWAKEFDNGDNLGYLYIIDGSGTDWPLATTNKFYTGDFNGDGQQDLLCINYTNGTDTNNRIAVLTYTNSFSLVTGQTSDYHISAGWSVLWDNGSNSHNGGGIYPYRNSLLIGDFDGDHKDDVFGLGGWMTWFTYAGGSTGWNWMDSNYGTTNNPSHPMSYMTPYALNANVGDFYSNGKAAFIGVSMSDWITTFQLNSSGAWTWVETNNGQTNTSSYPLSYLTPYALQFIPGDFDGDGQVEILGNQSTTNGASAPIAIYKHNNSTNTWTQLWYDATGTTSGVYNYRGNIQVGNFDADNNYEILGINSTYCVVFDYGSGTLGWDGSYYSTISDLNIAPGTNTYNNYLFMNVDKNNSRLITEGSGNHVMNFTQQLLSLRNTTSFKANLYAFRPNNSSLSPCSTLRLADPTVSINNENHLLNNNDLVLYPNPNNGTFTVEANTKTKQTLMIYDLSGRLILNQTMIEKATIDVSYLLDGVYYVSLISSEGVTNKKMVIVK